MKFVKVVLTTLLCVSITSGLACTSSSPKSGSGCYLEYQADFSSIPQQNQSDYLNNTMQIMENRLMQYDTQFQIITSGTDRISIYIPDWFSYENANRLVGKPAELIFCKKAVSITTYVLATVNANDRMVSVEDVTGFDIGAIFVIGSGDTAEMQIIATINKERNILNVRQGFVYSHMAGENVINQWTPATGLIDGEEKALTGKYLLPNSYLSVNQQTGEPVVQFEWNEDGATLFSQITGSLIGKQLGIFLDNELLSAPTVQTQVGAKGIIEGMSLVEAQKLSIQLNTGALPLDLIQLDERQYLFRSGRLVTQNGSVLYCTFDLSNVPGDKTEDKLDYICQTVISHFKTQKNIEPCIYVMEPVFVVNSGDKVSMMIYLPIQLADDGVSIMSTLSLNHDILETYDYTVFDTKT
jgi:hypothetical protein